MSNLLNEAIVDAKALREAALKNAETVVIEKYSEEVKTTLEKLLEQDEAGFDPTAPVDPVAGTAEVPLDADPSMEDFAADPLADTEEGAEQEDSVDDGDNIPFAATNGLDKMTGKNLNGFAADGEDVEISIDLGALQEAIEQMSESEEVEIDEDEIASLLREQGEDCGDDGDEPLQEDEAWEDEEAGQDGPAGGVAAQTTAAADAQAETDDGGLAIGEKKPENESVDHSTADKLVDAIMERLTVDMGADLSGWAGRSSEDIKYALARALASRRSTGMEDELQIMKKAQEELVFENNQLTEQNSQYKQAFLELKENLQDVNLSNARLLYTNRVLRNTSFNERQKDKIAEAISSAGSVIEARTIFDTLQSTVEAKPKRSPKSLSEAIGRRSSVIRASRATETPSSDPITDRMKKLAGIK